MENSIEKYVNHANNGGQIRDVWGVRYRLFNGKWYSNYQNMTQPSEMLDICDISIEDNWYECLER